jgi:hypothetical protein
MTSLDDLMWLYKMAIQFNLEAEKQWLKEEIEQRMAKSVSENHAEDKAAA